LLAVGPCFWENGDGTVGGAHALEEADEHAADLDDIGNASIALAALHEIGVTAELKVIFELGARADPNL
jgi:hypothetical protein